MIISEFSNLEITMSDLGKVVILDHVEAKRHTMQDLKSEQMIVVDAEQLGHEKQLADHVDQVE